jgi:hypothetical protein
MIIFGEFLYYLCLALLMVMTAMSALCYFAGGVTTSVIAWICVSACGVFFTGAYIESFLRESASAFWRYGWAAATALTGGSAIWLTMWAIEAIVVILRTSN